MGKMKQRENESGKDKIKPGIKLSVWKCAFNMLAFASLESTWPFVGINVNRKWSVPWFTVFVT